MDSPVIVVWALLAVGAAFLLRWAMKSRGRKPTPRTAKHGLVALLVASLAGWLTERYLGDEPSVVWAGRLVMLVLGSLHLWGLYYIGWTERHGTDYKKDSLLPEGAFTLLLGLLVSICFAASPRAIPFLKLPFQPEDITMWDAPLLFLFPWLVLKLFDIAGQIPPRVVENPWVYPLEEVNTEHWPWRDLIRVHFRVSKSLRDDGRLFGRSTTPWIEVPREAVLGKVFRLNMQEHRKHRRDTIQDLGNEYAGEPLFWWLFHIRRVWWKPSSWSRKVRYLDPDQSLAANEVRNGDVIRACRISKDALEGVDYRSRRQQPPIDPDKTVLIHR